MKKEAQNHRHKHGQRQSILCVHQVPFNFPLSGLTGRLYLPHFLAVRWDPCDCVLVSGMWKKRCELLPRLAVKISHGNLQPSLPLPQRAWSPTLRWKELGSPRCPSWRRAPDDSHQILCPCEINFSCAKSLRCKSLFVIVT